jgi:ElaB/YqjD/DUF883 family membrane-anchored ribosome-binding protein
MPQARAAAGDGNDARQSVADANEVIDAATDQTVPKEKLVRMAREARDKLNGVLSDLGAKAGAAQESVRKGWAQAESSVKSGVAHTETQIKENPWAAVGIAAGVGVLLGLLINRRQ